MRKDGYYDTLHYKDKLMYYNLLSKRQDVKE